MGVVSNCRLSASGYGERYINVTRIMHGVKFTGTEDGGRNGRVWYPQRQTSGSFGLAVIFSDHRAYEKFVAWVVEYIQHVSNPDGVAVAMRAQVPARKFDKLGVPSDGLTFARSYDEVTHELSLSFVGVADPVSLNGKNVSKFAKPSVGYDESKYFYPSGTQLSNDDRRTAAILERLRSEQGNRPIRGAF